MLNLALCAPSGNAFDCFTRYPELYVEKGSTIAVAFHPLQGSFEGSNLAIWLFFGFTNGRYVPCSELRLRRRNLDAWQIIAELDFCQTEPVRDPLEESFRFF